MSNEEQAPYRHTIGCRITRGSLHGLEIGLSYLFGGAPILKIWASDERALACVMMESQSMETGRTKTVATSSFHLSARD